MQRFLEKLTFLFEDNERNPNLKNIIKEAMWEYQQSGDTEWQKYKKFNVHKYARNLIEINPNYEALLICWSEGQESPIHNHAVCSRRQHYFEASPNNRIFLGPRLLVHRFRR